eukprot:225997-Chlamydomonas_euryale.AAC.1
MRVPVAAHQSVWTCGRGYGPAACEEHRPLAQPVALVGGERGLGRGRWQARLSVWEGLWGPWTVCFLGGLAMAYIHVDTYRLNPPNPSRPPNSTRPPNPTRPTNPTRQPNPT